MKEKIAVKAQELFFQRGIKSVSLDDIASELGISKKTIYTHFESKEEIVSYNIDNHLNCNKCEIDSISSKSSNAIEELIGIYHMNCEQHSQMNPIFIFDLKKYYAPEWQKMEKFLNEQIPQTVLVNIKRGQEEGYYRTELYSEFVAYLYVRSVISLIDYFSKQKNTSITNLIKEFIIYHIRGIGTDKGIKYLEKINLEQ